MSEQSKEITREEKRAKWIGVAVLVGVSLLFVGLLAWYSYSLSAPDTPLNVDFYELGGTAPMETQRLMSCLSDGFFVVGVLLTAVGCLTWISSTGFFDMLAYGFQGLKTLVMPFKAPKKVKPFYDYKTERAAKRKNPLGTVLLVGIAYLLLAVVFAMLFYNV